MRPKLLVAYIRRRLPKWRERWFVDREMFDAYSRQARLQPALLALFPIFFSIAVWVPALYELVAGLVGLAVACGVTVALAHVARLRGRITEQQLFKNWGGKPSAPIILSCLPFDNTAANLPTKIHISAIFR